MGFYLHLYKLIDLGDNVFHPLQSEGHQFYIYFLFQSYTIFGCLEPLHIGSHVDYNFFKAALKLLEVRERNGKEQGKRVKVTLRLIVFFILKCKEQCKSLGL